MASREERVRGGRKVRRADPNLPPFSSFLERDADRALKQKRRRRTIFISLGVHVFALGVLAFLSFWDVDELFGPTVTVTVFSPSKAPAAARPSGQSVQLTPAFPPAPAGGGERR
jgi:hypothetical protein